MKKLGFGCMRLPVLASGEVDIDLFCRMVDEYLAHGFTYFDTSYVYHAGKSEEAVRRGADLPACEGGVFSGDQDADLECFQKRGRTPIL